MDVEGNESVPPPPVDHLTGDHGARSNIFSTPSSTTTATGTATSNTGAIVMQPSSSLLQNTVLAAPAAAFIAASPMMTLMNTIEKPNPDQIRAYEEAVNGAMEQLRHEFQVKDEAFQLHDAIDKAVRKRDHAIDEAARERVDEHQNYKEAKLSEFYKLKQSLSMAKFKAATPLQEERPRFIFQNSFVEQDHENTAAKYSCNRNLFGETTTPPAIPNHLFSNALSLPFNHPSPGTTYAFNIGVGDSDKKRPAKYRIKPKTRTPIKARKKG